MRSLFHRPATNVSESSDPVPPTKPVEQLKLLGAETNRQLLVVAARRTGFHTRAAILVTAAGVLTTVQVSSWVSGWQFISVSLSVAAAVIGLIALRPVPTKTADITANLRERLSSSAYAVNHMIVTSAMEELTRGRAQVEAIAKVVSKGYVILVLSWLSTLVITAMPHVRIV